MTGKYTPKIDPSLQMSLDVVSTIFQRAEKLKGNDTVMQSFLLMPDETGNFEGIVPFMNEFINELSTYASAYEFLEWPCDRAKERVADGVLFLTGDDFGATLDLYRQCKLPAIDCCTFVEPGIILDFMVTTRVVQLTVNVGARTGKTPEVKGGFTPIESNVLILGMRK